MSSYRTRIRRFALSIGSGAWQHDALLDRIQRALDGGPPDPARLTTHLLLLFEAGQTPSPARLIAALAEHDAVHQALSNPADPTLPHILLDPPLMQPPTPRLSLPLPPLETLKALQVWLGLSAAELAWLADRAGLQRHSERAKPHHYRYRWVAKARGGWRLIEQPKARLKTLQRQILYEILNRIPPHQAAHGFRRRRSCLSHASAHVGRDVILQMDLQDFFTSVPASRVGAVFRRVGYPATVAYALQGLCTHATSLTLAAPPADALDWLQRKQLQHKHLAQGAPSSPALANLCAWRFDSRMHGLAQRFDLNYTRYADDIALSGSRRLISLAPFLQTLIGAIALDEGFRINHRKTRVNTRCGRQSVTGIVVNHRPNISRDEFDRLKATLHNCARYGPANQNHDGVHDFRAHLQGRLAHMRWLNPDKATRLQRLWDKIDWSN